MASELTYGEHDGSYTVPCCGYFDAAYLGYEAAEGIDFLDMGAVRMEDLSKLRLWN